jgi:outer membrane protein assembly factor BamB
LNQKGLTTGIVVLLLVASSFVGLSNQTEQVPIGTNKLETPNEMPTYSGPMDSAWPTYSHDNRHTGQSSYPTKDNPVSVKWKFEAKYLGFESSPVIDNNGVLYIVARDNNLYAVNPDGSERWRYNINDWGSDSPALAEDGTVYTGSHDGYLYAINSDSSLKWRFPAGDSIWGRQPLEKMGLFTLGCLGLLDWASVGCMQ